MPGGTTLNERQRVKGVVSSRLKPSPVAQTSARCLGGGSHGIWPVRYRSSLKHPVPAAHRRLATSVPPARGRPRPSLRSWRATQRQRVFVLGSHASHRRGKQVCACAPGRHAKSMPYKTPDMSEINPGGTTLNERQRADQEPDRQTERIRRRGADGGAGPGQGPLSATDHRCSARRNPGRSLPGCCTSLADLPVGTAPH